MQGTSITRRKSLPGGIKPIEHRFHLVPVNGPVPDDLSVKERDIYVWLLSRFKETNSPISALEVVRQFGTRARLYSPVREVKMLPDWPLEHLLDASLLYVVEDSQ